MIKLKGFVNADNYFSDYGEIELNVDKNQFPDGSLMLKMDENFHVRDLEWHYESDAELFTVICLAKKYYLDSLLLPYVPHARMDRTKNESDVFTLKYFADVINSLGFSEIKVLDPHSNVTTALLNNVVVQSPELYIKRAICKIDSDQVLMFYPDEGSVKRYSDMFKRPYAFGIKKRDWNTGEILGLDVIGAESVSGKDILIVDDICSRGGTFLHSAKKLKELGANKIYLYVTHCENTILEGDLLTSGLIEKVFTTDSIFNQKHEMIEVFEYEDEEEFFAAY